ncbi:hypothetical protein [Streptomyces aureus]
MSEYSDVQKAVRVEKFRIWLAWLAGSLVLLFVWRAVAVFSKLGGTVAGVVAGVLFVLLTVTGYRMVSAVNRRADRERRQVLGEDYPG